MRRLFQENILILLCVILSFCALVSCGSTAEGSFADAGDDISYSSDNPQTTVQSTEAAATTEQREFLTVDTAGESAWMLVIIRETPPQNYTQNITVIDGNGSVYKEKFTSAHDSFHINDENWYGQLTDLCISSDPTETLAEDARKTVSDFMGNAGAYQDVPVTSESSGLKDYGGSAVYGVWFDQGEAHSMKICNYGAKIECIDHDDARAFANDLISLNLFYTIGFEF